MHPLAMFHRNTDIAEMFLKEDISFSELGRRVNVTGSRVSQVVAKLIRMMRHPSRLKGDVIPDHDTSSMKEVRNHKEFWLKQLVKLKDEYKYRKVSDNPSDPIMVSKGIYIVRNYKAVRTAIDAHMNGISFRGYENYVIPDRYPSLICIHPSMRGADYVSITSAPLKDIEPYMFNALK